MGFTVALLLSPCSKGTRLWKRENFRARSANFLEIKKREHSSLFEFEKEGEFFERCLFKMTTFGGYLEP